MTKTVEVYEKGHLFEATGEYEEGGASGDYDIPPDPETFDVKEILYKEIDILPLMADIYQEFIYNIEISVLEVLHEQ